jgi:FAD/FMN-containing dehydrogenase
MLGTLTFPAPVVSHPAPQPRTMRVRSAEELKRALREARERPLILDASALDRVLRLDAEREYIEVQPAMSWQALTDYLSARGVALDAFAAPSRMPASIGDAVSVNAPGPDGAPIVSHVEAVTLATPDGDLRRTDRTCHSELFRLAVGGQGVFGVLYSVTLRLDSLRHAAARAEGTAAIELPAAGEGLACESETLVPPEALEAFLADARVLAAEERVDLQHLAVRRLRAERETFLRWAVHDWAGVTLRYRVRRTLGASVRAAEIRKLLTAAALARGGSFPTAACARVSRAQLEACYPQIGAFLAEKRRYDPAERLQNAWYRSVTQLLRGGPCRARWAR